MNANKLVRKLRLEAVKAQSKAERHHAELKSIDLLDSKFEGLLHETALNHGIQQGLLMAVSIIEKGD